MEKFKNIISSAGFKVNEYDDVKKMEMIDLLSESEMKKEIYPLETRFIGSDGRRIISGLTDIKIDYNKNLLIEEKITNLENTYIISSKNNPSRIKISVTKPTNDIDLSYVGVIKVNVVDKEENINDFNIYQLPTKAIAGINNENTELLLEYSNSNKYMTYISGFIENNGLYEDEDMKKGMSIVTPIVNKDIKKIFTYIELNKDRYIEKMNREKTILFVEYESKIEKLNKDIEILDTTFTKDKIKIKSK